MAKTTTITFEEAQALLAKQGVTVEPPAPTPGPLRAKVAEKGGVSVYGVNAKFPVTLYREQWERVIPFLNSTEFKAVLLKAPTRERSKAVAI